MSKENEDLLQSFFINKSNSFFGREEALFMLNKSFCSKLYTGNHWGVHGARRVGKTTLIQHFIKQKQEELNDKQKFFSLNLTGDRNAKKQEEIDNALLRLHRSLFELGHSPKQTIEEFLSPLGRGKAESWRDFFEYTIAVLKEVVSEDQDCIIMIFFDELDWFSDNEDFISGYSSLINQAVFPAQNLMTFIASSSNSWIRSRIFNDVNGLHRRIQKLELKPFTFKEIVSFFKLKNWISSPLKIIEYYLLFGGILKHYQKMSDTIDFNRSLTENWKAILNERSYIEQECLDIFRNLFDDKNKYKKICFQVCRLKHCTGLMVQEKLSQGKSLGRATSVLQTLSELTQAGVLSYTKNVNQHWYYCSNPLIFYYFMFWDNENETFLPNEDKFNLWRGSAFELLVLDNFSLIEKTLGFKAKEIKANLKISKEDLIKQEDKSTLAQADLIAKEKPNKFWLFEVKCQSFSKIEESEILKLIKRKDLIEQVLSKQLKNVLVEPVFITLDEPLETKVRRYIGFTELLLKK